MFDAIILSDLPGLMGKTTKDEDILNVLSSMCCHDHTSRLTALQLSELIVRLEIVACWNDIETKKNPPPYIPDRIKEQRTTIPDFEMECPTTNYLS